MPLENFEEGFFETHLTLLVDFCGLPNEVFIIARNEILSLRVLSHYFSLELWKSVFVENFFHRYLTVVQLGLFL